MGIIYLLVILISLLSRSQPYPIHMSIVHKSSESIKLRVRHVAKDCSFNIQHQKYGFAHEFSLTDAPQVLALTGIYQEDNCATHLQEKYASHPNGVRNEEFKLYSSNSNVYADDSVKSILSNHPINLMKNEQRAIQFSYVDRERVFENFNSVENSQPALPWTKFMNTLSMMWRLIRYILGPVNT